MHAQITQQSIETLAAKLTGEGLPILSREETTLLATALYELAHARVQCARQERLLESVGQDLAQIEGAAAGAVGVAQGIAGRDPAAGYDPSSARAAREQLLIEIEGAESGEAILRAVLRFVAIGAALAG